MPNVALRRRMRVVILASGAGSLADALMADTSHTFEVIALLSDIPTAPALEKAGARGIGTTVVDFKNFPERADWEVQLALEVGSYEPDLVISVGFMRLLSAHFLDRFKVINSHPSLLPHFPGAHPVRDALAAGVSQTGCTVHWVDAGIDTGEVISQRHVELLPGDNEEVLHERIKVVERELIVEVLTALAKGIS